jgi:hypothetical protein
MVPRNKRAMKYSSWPDQKCKNAGCN